MAIPVAMPKSGISVESCILTKWNVKVGDAVKVGDVMFAYETDKSSFEYQAEAEGEVLALFCEEGDEVPVLSNVAALGKKGEDASALNPKGGAPVAAPVEAAPVAAPAQETKVVMEEATATAVFMPKSGISVESCILTKWNVKVGDTVKVGDVMFGYETDKSSFEYQAEAEGKVLALFCEEGDEVPVLSNVAALGKDGDTFESLNPKYTGKVVAASTEAAPVVAAPVAAAPVSTASQNNEGRIFVSPRAKNLAVKLGVDLATAIPTGPKGRIVESDVRLASVNKPALETAASVATPAAAPAPVAAPVEAPKADFSSYTDEKMSNIRKVIAKNMMNSLSSMAQLTHTLTFDATNIIEFRKYLKDNAEKLNLPPITINHIIIFAVSRVIKNHKVLNAHLLNGETLRYFDHVNMGIATDTPKGLLVPTLMGADTLTLSEIAKQAKKLSSDAIDGKLSPSLLTGASFTISNVGAMGIESFTPVINPPQTGILGVDAFTTRIKVGANGEIIPYQAMGLSLTYDHRATDGAPASRFLKDLKDYLENFSVNLFSEII